MLTLLKLYIVVFCVYYLPCNEKKNAEVFLGLKLLKCYVMLSKMVSFDHFPAFCFLQCPEVYSEYRGIFRFLLNIYSGSFFAKISNGYKQLNGSSNSFINIVDMCVNSNFIAVLNVALIDVVWASFANVNFSEHFTDSQILQINSQDLDHCTNFHITK